MVQSQTGNIPELNGPEAHMGWSRLCDFSLTGCLILDWKGIILTANSGAAGLLGVKQKDLVQTSLEYFIEPEYVENFLLHKEEVFLSRSQQTCEIRIRRTDGTVFDAQLQSMAMENDCDEAFHTIITDISEKIQLIRVLELSQEKLSLAIEGSGLGLWDWTIPTGEVTLNERWAQIIGYTLEELTPLSINTWMNLCHPDDLFQSSQKIQKHFFGGLDEYECEVRMKHKNGHWVWVLDRGKVTQWDANGNPLRMTGTHLDITERKRFEQERETLDNQLLQYSKMQAIGTLVGGLAHDFNNILQGILGFSELLMLENSQNVSAREKLKTIIGLANEQADLVNKLLLFGKQAPSRNSGAVRIGHLIRELKSVLTGAISDQYVIDVSIEGDAHEIQADPNQLLQCLLNLAINASEAMPDGGTIKIEEKKIVLDSEGILHPSLLNKGAYVMISVTDSGRGMDEETMRRMFDPFFSTKERGSVRGTGLGLSVARSIIETHGGQIDYKTELNHGTVFRIYLPCGSD